KEQLQIALRNWQPFLDQLKNVNRPAHATLQSSKPVAASKQTVIVGFKYEIHCSLFLEHKQMVETIYEQVIGRHVTLIPIPLDSWMKLREEYVQKQGQDQQEDQKEEDPLITEARKL